MLVYVLRNEDVLNAVDSPRVSGPSCLVVYDLQSLPRLEVKPVDLAAQLNLFRAVVGLGLHPFVYVQLCSKNIERGFADVQFNQVFKVGQDHLTVDEFQAVVFYLLLDGRLEEFFLESSVHQLVERDGVLLRLAQILRVDGGLSFRIRLVEQLCHPVKDIAEDSVVDTFILAIALLDSRNILEIESKLATQVSPQSRG